MGKRLLTLAVLAGVVLASAGIGGKIASSVDSKRHYLAYLEARKYCEDLQEGNPLGILSNNPEDPNRQTLLISAKANKNSQYIGSTDANASDNYTHSAIGIGALLTGIGVVGLSRKKIYK